MYRDFLSQEEFIDPTSPPAFARVSVVSAWLDIWHRRLSHLSFPLFVACCPTSVSVVALSLGRRLPSAKGASKGKSPVLPSHPAIPVLTLLLLLCTQIFVMGVQSEGQARYMLVLMDDWSRYTWVYFVRHKSDAFSCFMRWLPAACRTQLSTSTSHSAT